MITHAPAPVLVRLADVQPESIRWLWPGRMAIGKLTLVAGDPGLGKSLLTLDVAARVSRGAPWPDEPDQPDRAAAIGGVVLLSAEDDIADTIRPRLDAAEADVGRIVALTAVRGRDAEGDYRRPVDLSRDLEGVEAATKQVDGCRLVVIDPLTAYLGRTDSHRNAEIRGLLAPLAELAGRQGVAVVAVTHLRKGEGPAIYRSMGSLAFVAAARAVWAVAADQDDGTRRLFLPVKNNLAPDRQGLAYQITQREGVPALEWEPDPVDISADEALREANDQNGRSPLDEAVEWLRETLAYGPVEGSVVKTRGRRDGIAPRTLDRAKAKLGVIAAPDGFRGRWMWGLPDSATVRQDSPECATPETLAHSGKSGALCENEWVEL